LPTLPSLDFAIFITSKSSNFQLRLLHLGHFISGPSGLGLDPLKVGFLQLAFGLSMMIFGPVFGLIVAKRRGLNLKLLIPGIVITAISFLLLLFFHSTSQAINGALFVFGVAGRFYL
jgi:predicted MFS family arabinose efflux permease